MMNTCRSKANQLKTILPIQSCVGAIANRGQWSQGCSLFMTTDLDPNRATRRKKQKKTLYNIKWWACMWFKGE